MTTIATLAVKLIADTTGFTKAMDEAERTTNNWSSRVSQFTASAGQGLQTIGQTILTGAAVATGMALTGVTVALGKSVSEAMEAQKVQAQLNAVLKSTKGAAGVTAEMVNKLADQYGNLTMFEDDAIVSGENILLTFTNIGKDVFPLATTTMLDMSQALGQDMKSSAIQLGKALQDPINGVSALQRVGVNFTDEQKKMIEEMVKSGNVMGAQKMILQELQTEFGGSAEAAGKTGAGLWARLQHILNNVSETIGTALLPAITILGENLVRWLASEEVQNGIKKLAAWIEEFSLKATTYFPIIMQKIREVFGWLMENKGVIVAAVAAIGVAIGAAILPVIIELAPAILVMAAVAAVAYLLYTAWTENWGGIQETMAAFWAWLQPTLQDLWNWLSVNVPLALQALQTWWTETWAVIQPVLQAFWAWLQPILQDLWNWLSVNVPLALKTTQEGWNTLWAFLQPILQAVWDWLKVNLPIAIQYLIAEWQFMAAGVQAVWGIVQDVISLALEYISAFMQGKLGWISQIWHNTWTAIGTLVDLAMQNIGLVIELFHAAQEGDWRKFGEILRKLWDNMWKGIFTILKTTWENIGIALNAGWEKLKQIFSDGWENLKTFVASIPEKIRNFFVGAQSIDWGQVGLDIILGIANGLLGGLATLQKNAEQVADAILQVIKGFLGIQSPSKVFEMEVGWQMAAGTALGWQRGVDNLLQPALELSPAMAGISDATSQRLGGGGRGNVNVTVENRPLLSLGERYEAEQVLKPILQSLLREMGV